MTGHERSQHGAVPVRFAKREVYWRNPEDQHRVDPKAKKLGWEESESGERQDNIPRT